MTTAHEIDLGWEVLAEIDRAASVHGRQEFLPSFHPDGHGIMSGDEAKAICQQRFADGTASWADILLEEVCEAFDERDDPVALREELLQVAAMAIGFVRSLDWHDQRARGGCRTHPRYQAKMKPRVDCDECLAMFAAAEAGRQASTDEEQA